MADELPRNLRRELDGAQAAHRALAAAIADLDDATARRASLLPGWSVGHVLTHLARNADGMTGMLVAAARGEVADQYPGGAEQRNGDIEAGAGRSATALVDDVVVTSAALEAAAAVMTAEQWASGVGRSFGGTIPIADVPFRRRREVVVHHSDLGLSGVDEWRAWPADFVRAELGRLTMQWASGRPMGMTTLPAEALDVPEAQRVAWLLGRAEIAGLAPAGVL